MPPLIYWRFPSVFNPYLRFYRPCSYQNINILPWRSYRARARDLGHQSLLALGLQRLLTKKQAQKVQEPTITLKDPGPQLQRLWVAQRQLREQRKKHAASPAKIQIHAMVPFLIISFSKNWPLLVAPKVFQVYDFDGLHLTLKNRLGKLRLVLWQAAGGRPKPKRHGQQT